MAKNFSLKFLEDFRIPLSSLDKVALKNIAKTSLGTKLQPDLANQ